MVIARQVDGWNIGLHNQQSTNYELQRCVKII
jgi:hypothetical protein